MSAPKTSAEIPNFISLFAESFPENHTLHFFFKYQTVFFAMFCIILASTIVYIGMRKPKLIPSPLQNFIEFVFEMLYGLISSILGEKHARHYFPFLAGLFVYIISNNLIGLIPLFKSATGVYTTTVTLAIMTFVYVQWTAFTKLGPLKYLFHLAGEPRELAQYILAPFMFVLHVISELARPLTLSLRLFGNIMGEDILLGVFAGFGIAILSTIGIHEPPVGIPLQFPFYFLCIIGSVVQALVFTLLSTIYFSLVLPHEEEEH